MIDNIPLHLLGSGVILAFCLVAFLLVPKNWYANLLSLANLFCGLAGCWVVVSGRPMVYAFGLVLLGQFLDLFDGRAAERWGSTPRGELFDDAADGMSFGLTISVMVACSFSQIWASVAIGGLYLGATLYRLVRFVIEKRRQGILGGVATFAGMPSPAGALLAGTTCLLFPNELLKAVIVIATALLMISRVPYAHFGRSLLPKTSKALQVLILVSFLVVVALGVRHEQYTGPLLLTFVASLIYLVSPCFATKLNLQET